MQNNYLDQIDFRNNFEKKPFEWYEEYAEMQEELLSYETKLKDLTVQNDQMRKIIEKHIDVD